MTLAVTPSTGPGESPGRQSLTRRTARTRALGSDSTATSVSLTLAVSPRGDRTPTSEAFFITCPRFTRSPPG